MAICSSIRWRAVLSAVACTALAVALIGSPPPVRAQFIRRRRTPTPRRTATPTPTPTPASCIDITSPPANTILTGWNVPISTQDECSGAWYESLYVDNTRVADYVIGTVILDSNLFANGVHTIKVTSQSENPGTIELGSASEPLNIQNGYFTVQPTGVALSDDATCNSQIATTNETIIGLQVPGQSFTSSNTAFNAQVPTPAELNTFATNRYFFDPLYDYSQFQRITGAYPTVHGKTPSTDMILRFAACKYGIDEDVVRAQAWQESGWRQAVAGDDRIGASSCIQGSFTSLYDTAISLIDGNTIPRIPDGCYQSWGIHQTKVFYEWMTWPAIKDSTTFAAENREATQRTCMIGGYEYMPASYMIDVNNYLNNPNGIDPDAAVWDSYPGLTNEPTFAPTYANRVMWGCIGSHYAGYDWLDSYSLPYIRDVQGDEACKRWRHPSNLITGVCRSPINQEGY